MSDYTPTRQHVRAVWLDAYPDEFRGQGGAAFDRFIAALRAEWEAEQLAEQGEVEWEYSWAGTDDEGVDWVMDDAFTTRESAEAYTRRPIGGWVGTDNGKLVRRRKAGPWVPVNENGENQ